MNMHQMKSGVAVFLCTGIITPCTCLAVPISGQGSWGSTLQGRDLDGNISNGFEAYYDTVLDITWLADANYAMTNGYDSNGVMTWSEASSWVASLSYHNSATNRTIAGWRLPTVSPVNGNYFVNVNSNDGSTDKAYNISAAGSAYPGTTASELAHLFFISLGNKAIINVNGNYQIGGGLTNTGPFMNIQTFPATYWSDTTFPITGANPPYAAYGFEFTGLQGTYWVNYNAGYAWAVHDGDVSASTVPTPASIWLISSGLLGLIGSARNRLQTNRQTVQG